MFSTDGKHQYRQPLLFDIKDNQSVVEVEISVSFSILLSLLTLSIDILFKFRSAKFKQHECLNLASAKTPFEAGMFRLTTLKVAL